MDLMTPSDPYWTTDPGGSREPGPNVLAGAVLGNLKAGLKANGARLDAEAVDLLLRGGVGLGEVRLRDAVAAEG